MANRLRRAGTAGCGRPFSASTKSPARMRSAFTRCAVLTRLGSLKSTVMPPSAICRATSPSRTMLSRRGARACVRRQVRITVVSRSTVKGMAFTRWLHSMSTSVCAGGRSRPWQSGQSGQLRPDPVALTMLPMVMSRKRATIVAQANPRGMLAAMRHADRRHGHVITARGLPAEEYDADRDEEDEPAGDPHDETAQVLIEVRGEDGPDAGGGRIVRIQYALRHRDEDRHDDHR